LPGLIDSKVPAYSLGKNRLAHGGEAGELTLVAIVAKTKCPGRGGICLSKAVDRRIPSQPLIAAIYFLNLTIDKPPTAVVDVVAAAVGSNQQGIIPVAVEKRRYRVRPVMIVKINNDVVPESAVARK